ncbi:methyltransferase domain-containing protein [uncultured Roseobacter sp.]|uniref:class I SAM-dependent methyltransferase n=1 Tax=uncultured Roseobacter sp. TaxID=114847 RepID=UPI00263360FD|nr:methyltransferase domain-containing protein [uncultured Roseobacter sp.]
MPHDTALLDRRYASAAPKWSDRMRLLGYYDGYLGLLSHLPHAARKGGHVIDIGAGTGAMAEAWVAVNGAPERLALLDPSAAMLASAETALTARGVDADYLIEGLNAETAGQFDVLLAAHVIEHFKSPQEALRHMRRLARPGAQLWLSVSKPHWCSVLIWLQWQHRTFRPAEIDQMLQSAGFVAEQHYAFPAGPPSRTSFGVVARAV